MKALTILMMTVAACVRHAQAVEIPMYDMASLTFLSDAVVVCTESPAEKVPVVTRPGNVHWTANRVKATVRQVLKGNLTTDTTIDVYWGDEYKRVLFTPSNWGPSDASPVTGVTKVAMFLKYDESLNGYRPVPGGMKLIRDSDVLGWRQLGNPGPLVLTPQKPEFVTLEADKPYREAEFMRNVEAALAKASTLKEAERTNRRRTTPPIVQ